MKRICVFAGSNLGFSDDYKGNAIKLGEILVQHNIELVYGGSRMGLMGEVANSVLKLGGRVVGIMPRGLFHGEIVHNSLTELIEVNDMHERKAMMNKLSDGYIALPGGLGTFEEIFEVLSWAAIGIHRKPLGLLNINDYYTPVVNLVNHGRDSGFVKDEYNQLFLAEPEPDELIKKMQAFTSPLLDNKWN